jgi:hypothetical protein
MEKEKKLTPGRLNVIFGKSGEFLIIHKLMEHKPEYEIYTPILDMNHSDCIIRNQKGDYLRLQIKTSRASHNGNKLHADGSIEKYANIHLGANVENLNFDYLVCAILDLQKESYSYYIIPKKEIEPYSNCVRLTINPVVYHKFDNYLDSWHLLDNIQNGTNE